jgi:hypothetical protein
LNGLSGGSPLRWSVASALFYFSGYGFPIRRMSPLEVLRQTCCCAAGQAPVSPVHFR